MRQYKLLFFMFLLANLSLKAQSVEDVFKQKQMTWYGLDFSMAKFVGSFSNISYASNKGGWEIKGRYFNEWNSVVLNEREKYDLRRFYKKENVKYDLTDVNAVNAMVNPDSIMPWNPPSPLTDAQLQSAVSRYDTKSKQGLGLVYIVELFDKSLNKGIIHVTFFDMASGKVLLTKRIETEPGGFGLRNYWARTAYETMEECADEWKKWAKAAGVKL